MDPHQKYIMKSLTPNSSGEFLVSNVSSTSLPRSHNTFTILQKDNNSYSSLSSQPSPSQRSHHHHHVPDGTNGDFNNAQQQSNEQHAQKSSKTRRHYRGHCNPCIGHFVSKQEKGADKDNTSLDAYDLAGEFVTVFE